MQRLPSHVVSALTTPFVAAWTKVTTPDRFDLLD